MLRACFSSNCRLKKVLENERKYIKRARDFFLDSPIAIREVSLLPSSLWQVNHIPIGQTTIKENDNMIIMIVTVSVSLFFKQWDTTSK